MVKFPPPAPALPAASDGKVSCVSPSVVPRLMVNSGATRARANGMGRLRAYRAAVDGKRRGNNTRQTVHPLPDIRRLIFAAATVFVATISGSASYAQSAPV